MRVALGAFVVLTAVTVVWGHHVAHHAARSIKLGALPFFGYWALSASWGLVIAASTGALLVVVLPRLVASASWHRVLLLVVGASAGFSAALTLVDPPSMRWRTIATDYGQHIGLVDAAGGPGGFLRHYVDQQLSLPTHLSAHPPGLPLLLWVADRVGLSGSVLDAALGLLGAGLAAAAAVFVARELAGEEAARQAAPFVVLAPAAIWHTNADALYAGVALVATALVVRSTRRPGAGTAWAVTGGALFGVALLGSYGIAVLALSISVISGARRAGRSLVVAAVAAGAVLLLPALWGFSWLAGLQATREAYAANLADVRPYWFFVVADLAVAGAALGPAVLVGLTRLRVRSLQIVVGAGIVAIAVADLSGLASGEVERIWQPFFPLLLVAGAAAARGARWGTRQWLALQVASTVALQAFLRSPW